jgi:putative ABC transport system permease protein
VWARRFGARPDVLGATMQLDGERYVVIGVMPKSFAFAPFWATRAEIWAPLAFGPRAAEHGGGSLRVFARLAPGVSIDRARDEMVGVTRQLERAFPGTNRDIRVTDLTQQVVGNVRTPLLLILGAASCVLLIACANVAHMLLARATARQRDVAVRMALGATRARAVRRLLTESAVLASFGGIAGLLLARLSVRLLVTFEASSIPRASTITIDARVIAVTIAMTLATGLLFGLTPALRASVDEGRRPMDRGGRNRTRHALIASEFALALMLLVGAGLLIRSFIRLEERDPGYDPRNVLTMVIPVTGTPESPADRRAAFYDAVLERMRTLPGVSVASAVNHIPIGGDGWGWPFHIEGQPKPRPGESPVASYKVVMPRYFDVMSIRLLAGRDVTPSDRLGAPGVVVVNEYLAKQYWPHEGAIGKRLTLTSDSTGQPIWLTVVGIVHNTIHDQWAEPPEEEVFVPFAQQPDYLGNPSSHFAYMSFVVRVAPGVGNLIPSIRATVRSLDPTVAVAEVQTMTRVVESATARQRFYLVLLGAFAAIALVLATVGIYGVMSYAVSSRTHEIGLRMALGARPNQLLSRVIGDGMTAVAIGGAAGILGALALSQLIATMLYGVQPTDLLTFASVAIGLGLVALVGCYVPARRAATIDPLVALHAD